MRTLLLLLAAQAALTPAPRAQDAIPRSLSGTKLPERRVLPGGPAVPPPPRVVGEDATPKEHHKQIPAVPAGPAGPAGIAAPHSAPSGPAGANPAAPCDLVFYQDTLARPTNGATSSVCEPSIAQVQDTCFQVGNWYASRSSDHGRSWTYISPYTAFPYIDGGFCCDQRTLYIPSHDITVWLLEYSYSTFSQRGGHRIAVANGRADLRSGSWHSYYFTTSDLGRGSGEWLNYADIAHTDSFLYASANAFDGSGSYVDSVVWRIPLQQLAAGGPVTFDFANQTSLGRGVSYRFAQNCGSTMFFARFEASTSLRTYRWDDSSPTFSFTDTSVPGLTCCFNDVAPNGIRWLSRASRWVLSGFFRAPLNEFGFLWQCPSEASRPNAFVRTARFDATTNALLGLEDTWSPTHQLAYPACAVNARGDVGVTMAIADSTTLHPTNCYFIVDACAPTFAGQTLQWFNGTASPTRAGWSDFFSVQRHSHLPNTFVATGATTSAIGPVTEPHHIWFGREQDAPTPVTLTVTSRPTAGAPMTLDVIDRNGARDGNANFTRSFFPHQGYELTAPLTFTAGATTWVFDRWVSNGTPQQADVRTLTVGDMGTTDDTADARYVVRQTLEIRSDNPTNGIGITVSPADISGGANGTTPFDRGYKNGATVTLTAPALNGTHPFKQWLILGAPQPLGQTTITVNVSAPITVTAVYYTRVPGTYTGFCTGCPGTGNLVPSHAGAGTPEIGGTATWQTGNARPLAGGVLFVGASQTTYNGFPLPLALSIVNMGTCLLCVSIDVQLGLATDAAGNAVVNAPIPADVVLVGSRLFTQPAILDVGAPTPTPIVTGPALETLIGGNR